MVYPILNSLKNTAQLRLLPVSQLADLCQELRQFVQAKTQTKAGHIKSSLGVTELTVALHYVFNTPKDILIWDVGHQAYVHKILTQRKDNFNSNRLKGGLSGFTSRAESPFDPFGAGHSSTSISALAGFHKASILRQEIRQHIAVIGDGALTGGMAFEALNYLGEQQSNCLIILNDNQSSIDANVGALQKMGTYAAFAESLGWQFFEEKQGNNAEALCKTLKELKDKPGPKLLRVSTQKGMGFMAPKAAENNTPTPVSYQSIFGQTVLTLMQNNPKLVVLSPAMLSGANLGAAQKAFPQRVIDVGIAEQHVVTMAAGLAADGFFPLIHLYSTFAQRALDQIIHDFALQKLPGLICLDRAGLVGADGATHHGAFDISLLASIPNLKIMAPATATIFSAQLEAALLENTLSVIRFPKASLAFASAPLGDASAAPHWWKKGAEKCLVSFGSLAEEAQTAVENTPYAHLNIPVLAPFPKKELAALLAPFKVVLSIEENTAAGGLGAALQSLLTNTNLAFQHRALTLPHRFVAHGSRAQLLADCGLDARAIVNALEAPLLQ
jgi:1-deoxy-D-xylulose-5-phosphate synthase